MKTESVVQVCDWMSLFLKVSLHLFLFKLKAQRVKNVGNVECGIVVSK